MRTPRSAPTLLLLLLLLPTLFPGAAAGQELRVPRLDGPVALDGQVTEEAWLRLAPVPLTMFEPEFRGAITRRSEIRLAHDGASLYASAVFHDDGPLRADGLGRDFDTEDDIFNLVLDTFRDRRTALWFAVNPAGARLDGAITDDAEGGAWNHVEYDSYWDARAAVHAWGWSAEMRIPLSSLRFRPSDGRVVMGLIAGRKIARIRERYTFPATPPGPGFAQFKPSLAATAVLEGVDARPPRVAAPYVSGGLAHDAAFPGDWSTRRQVGGDLKLGLGQDLVLDLTANTDFAQTEVDDQRVNLTRFDLLYPERRAFFLERSGAFDFGDGREHRLFHSRRIGLDDQGGPLVVDVGARLAGRVGDWDVGALAMATEAPGGGEATNAAVRVRRSLLDGTSWVGAVASAVARGGSFASASGVDADLRLAGRQYLSLGVAASTDSTGWAGLDATHARLVLEDRDRQGFAYRLEATRVGDAYRPPLGFVLRRGAVARAEVSHGAFGGGGFLQQRVASLGGSALWRARGGGLESADLTARVAGVRAGGGEGFALLRVSREDLVGDFRLSPDAAVGAGRYTFVDGEVEVSTPTGRAWWGTLALRGGGFYDGTRLTVSLAQGWTAGKHASLQGDLELNRVRFAARGEAFDGVVSRLRLFLAADSRLSGSATLQYQSVDRAGGASLRVRYNFQEGEDLYLVLNGGVADEAAGPLDRHAWGWTQRTVLLKYTHAVRW